MRLYIYRITVEGFFQDWKHPESKRFHNLKYIEEVAKIPTKKVTKNLEGRQDFDESRAVSFDEISATTYSISDLYGFVKTFDKEFSPAPETSEYVLNDDGTRTEKLKMNTSRRQLRGRRIIFKVKQRSSVKNTRLGMRLRSKLARRSLTSCLQISLNCKRELKA